MATNPAYRHGVHLTTVTIQRLSRSSTGLFSNNGSPLDVQALVTRLGHNVRKEMENMQPVTSTRINMVPVSSGNAVTLTEMKRQATASILATVLDTASWVLLTWVEGNETYAGYYSVGEQSDGGITSRGLNTVTVQFEPCDPGQAQVTYTAA